MARIGAMATRSSPGVRRVTLPVPAAWPSGLGKGLQSPVHRFDSGRRLNRIFAVECQVRHCFSLTQRCPALTPVDLLKPLFRAPSAPHTRLRDRDGGGPVGIRPETPRRVPRALPRSIRSNHVENVPSQSRCRTFRARDGRRLLVLPVVLALASRRSICGSAPLRQTGCRAYVLARRPPPGSDFSAYQPAM